MKTVTLESFRDESTGELGLGIKGLARDESTNAAMDGLLIAHDLIEHVNGVGRIGSIDDELEALGAIWYVRGRHGELFRDRSNVRSVEKNLSGDIVRMFRDHIDGGQYVSPDTPRTRASDADDAIEAALVYADEGWRGEFYGEDIAEAAKAWPTYRAHAFALMRIGYREARAKWEKHGRFAANNQFWAIAHAVTPYMRGLEYEGREFKLRYGGGEATCEEVYSDY